MFKHLLGGLLVAGMCVPAFADEIVRNHHDSDYDHHHHTGFPVIEGDLSRQAWRDDASLGRDADDIREELDEHHRVVESPRVLGRSDSVVSQSEVRSSESNDVAAVTKVDSDVKTVDSDEPKADRVGPVPFADLGKVGGSDETLKTVDAIEQDKQLLVRGEERGDEIILHLPAGTHMDTLSLRSGAGLDLRHKDLMAISRIDGHDLIINKDQLAARGDFELSNLWVWGTGPESASLLQRVAMGEIQNREVARADADLE